MANDSLELTQWAKNGKHMLLVRVDRERLLACRDDQGNSVLSTAAFDGHQKTCEEILKICSPLLKVQNKEGSTVLHRAVSKDKSATLRYLAKSMEIFAKEGGENMVVKPDNEGRTVLHVALEEGYVSTAKWLIKDGKNQELIKMSDKKGDTAMHLAVAMQSLEMVELLYIGCPKLDYFANSSGETPHWIACQKALNCEPKSTAVAIRQFLIQKRPALCKVESGNKNWKLIHHSVDNGDLDATKEIIVEFPDCLEWVDKDDQNPLHILAANSEHAKLGEFILGQKDVITKATLNKQDKNGDTPLHIAGARGNKTFAELLLYNPEVDKFIKNHQGKRTFDLIKFRYDKKKAEVYGYCDGDEKEMIKEIYDQRVRDHANFDLLVSALIATVSFAAGIAVPGGYNNEEPNKGKAVLASKTSFRVFMVSDAIALLLSLYAVLCHFAAKHIDHTGTLLYQVGEARVCSLLAIFAMMAAFTSGIYSVLAVTDEFATTLFALCSSFFLFGLLPLCRISKTIRENILLPISTNVEKILGFSSRNLTTGQDGSSNVQGKQLEEIPRQVELVVHA